MTSPDLLTMIPESQLNLNNGDNSVNDTIIFVNSIYTCNGNVVLASSNEKALLKTSMTKVIYNCVCIIIINISHVAVLL